MSGDTSSDAALSKLQQWIAPCNNEHTSCFTASNRTASLPKRVLEIGSNHIYLREHLLVEAKYACLSHCWGSEGPLLKLKSTNMAEFVGGISPSRLPPTFRDTANLCSRLGIQYLWIDALCRVKKSFLFNDDLTICRHQTGR